MKKQILFIATFSLLLFFSDLTYGQVWEKNYGGDSTDVASSLIQISTGGYLATGFTRSYGVSGYTNFYLVRLNEFGDTIWTKTYGTPGDERVESVIEDVEGNIVMAGLRKSIGNTSSNIVLMKLDPDGNLVWEKEYDIFDFDYPKSLVQNKAGEYVIGGYTNDSWNDNMMILAVSANGDSLWYKGFGGIPEDRASKLLYIPQTNEYILAGESNSFSIDYDAYVIKLDSVGNVIWSRQYGGVDEDYIWSAKLLPDNTFILAGETWLGGVNPDAFALKMNLNGDSLWAKNFGGSAADDFISVQMTPDGNLMFAGNSASYGAGDKDFYMIKTDPGGNFLWETTFGNEFITDICNDLLVLSSGKMLFAGATSAFDPSDDMYILQTGPFGNPFYNQVSGYIYTNDSSTYEKGDVRLFRVFPNKEIMLEIQKLPVLTNGYYQFGNVEGGRYLIMAFPDIDSDPLLMPTYYGDVKYWWDAAVIDVTDTLMDLNIYLNEMLPPPTSGNGEVYGYILEGNINGKRMGPGDPLKGINVSILDKSSGSVVHWDESDSTGKFGFASFETGTYEILAEVPGLTVDTLSNTFDITESATMKNITFTVDSDMVRVNISDSTGSYIVSKSSRKRLNIYPNPSSGEFYIESGSSGNIIREIKVIAPDGKTIFTQKRNGNNKIQVHVHLTGIYFIEIITDQGVYIKKLIFQND